ncbi:transposase [Syntrophobacter fumaroxidans]|uniref:Transposase n=1 Tax=Syntrophobacter fumaroxidans (strain DSM 10017 / MPOB) TaxID=335543 RepID=A0LNB1_SYNFM|nr:transposase [Syntrophobacter fumaroxidans]ABK18913.1 transposase [Syntrophobacter fumaroxidans MPOB]
MAEISSRQLSDAFWEKVEPLIPRPERDPERSYRRKPGGGRKPLPPRKILEAVLYVLRTGCRWKSLPGARFGSPSAVHAHFTRWMRAGFFTRLWRAGLAEYDEMEGIAWRWQDNDAGTLEGAPADRKAGGRRSRGKGEDKIEGAGYGGRFWGPAVNRRRRGGSH